jgi:hypothetical protein
VSPDCRKPGNREKEAVPVNEAATVKLRVELRDARLAKEDRTGEEEEREAGGWMDAGPDRQQHGRQQRHRVEKLYPGPVDRRGGCSVSGDSLRLQLQLIIMGRLRLAKASGPSTRYGG